MRCFCFIVLHVVRVYGRLSLFWLIKCYASSLKYIEISCFGLSSRKPPVRFRTVETHGQQSTGHHNVLTPAMNNNDSYDTTCSTKTSQCSAALRSTEVCHLEISKELSRVFLKNKTVVRADKYPRFCLASRCKICIKCWLPLSKFIT